MGPNPVESVRITGTPENPSFQGFAPDLAGVTIVATYRDGTSRTLSLNEVILEPEFVFGHLTEDALANDFTWVPNRNVQVWYGGVLSNTIVLPTVHGIVRTGMIVGGDDEIFNDDFFTNMMFFSGGDFRVHGANRMQQSYYVDEAPNFSSLTAEVLYSDGTTKEFYLSDMPFGAIQGVIHPLYTAGPYESGEGIFFITFGRNPHFNPNRDGLFVPVNVLPPPGDTRTNNRPTFVDPTTDNSADDWFIVGVDADGLPVWRQSHEAADPGVTVALRVPTIHHVTNLELTSTPDIASMFYWEGNSQFNWRNRAVAADATFRVTYSNATSRTFTLAQLEQMPEVWRNPINVPGFVGPETPRAAPGTWAARPFNVRPVGNPWFDPDPTVQFTYRGHRVNFPVTIYQVLARVDVESDWTGTLMIDLDDTGSWDNDRWVPGGAITRAQDLAALLTVRAVYVTRRSPVQEGHIYPVYNHALARENWNPDYTISGLPSDEVLIGVFAQSPDFDDRLRVNAPAGAPADYPRLGRTFTMNFGVLGDPGDSPDATAWGLIQEGNSAPSDPRETLVRNVQIWYGAPGSWLAFESDGTTPIDEENFDGSITNYGPAALTAVTGPISIMNRLDP